MDLGGIEWALPYLELGIFLLFQLTVLKLLLYVVLVQIHNGSWVTFLVVSVSPNTLYYFFLSFIDSDHVFYLVSYLLYCRMSSEINSFVVFSFALRVFWISQFIKLNLSLACSLRLI